MTKKKTLERKGLLSDKEINTLTKMAERALCFDSPANNIGIAASGAGR